MTIAMQNGRKSPHLTIWFTHSPSNYFIYPFWHTRMNCLLLLRRASLHHGRRRTSARRTIGPQPSKDWSKVHWTCMEPIMDSQKFWTLVLRWWFQDSLFPSHTKDDSWGFHIMFWTATGCGARSQPRSSRPTTISWTRPSWSFRSPIQTSLLRKGWSWPENSTNLRTSY